MNAFKTILVALTFMLGLSSAAFAMDLDSAKTQGLVGEQQNGYIGLVTTNPSRDVETLVNDINARRHAAYESVAAQTEGAKLADVEKLAAAKLIARTPSGQIVQDVEGKWVKKP